MGCRPAVREVASDLPPSRGRIDWAVPLDKFLQAPEVVHPIAASALHRHRAAQRPASHPSTEGTSVAIHPRKRSVNAAPVASPPLPLVQIRRVAE